MTFTVTLHPSSEVVFCSGTEYFDAGTQFHRFAERRRDNLFETKVLDGGSLATIFSTDHRKPTTSVKTTSGWLAINERIFGTKSQGYFVLADGKVFQVTRTGTDWVNLGAEL